MSWFQKPEVERTTDNGIAVWQLLGDWTRDLPLNLRHQASAALTKDVPSILVLDLSDVKFIDSWGEETICDLLQSVLDADGRVAWTKDPSRSSEYEGLKHALERRSLAIEGLPSRAAAVAAVQGTS